MASREMVHALRHVLSLSNVSLGAVANSKGGPIRTQARKSVRRQATISSQTRYEEKPAGFPSSPGRLRRRGCALSRGWDYRNPSPGHAWQPTDNVWDGRNKSGLIVTHLIRT